MAEAKDNEQPSKETQSRVEVPTAQTKVANRKSANVAEGVRLVFWGSGK